MGTGTKKKLQSMLDELVNSHEEAWKTLEDDSLFWDARNRMKEFIDSLPDAASSEESAGRADAAGLWDGKGRIALADYLVKRAGLSEREAGLVSGIIEDAGELTELSDRLRYGHANPYDNGRSFRKILSVQLDGLGLDEYELLYFRKMCGNAVLDFPVTEDIVEDGFAGGLIKVTDGPGQGEQSAWIGDRRFLLDKDAPGRKLAFRICESIEKAFLSGRTADYAYADAVLGRGGRLYVVDYADNSNWRKPWNAGCDYESVSTINAEKRFVVYHVRGIRGQVREHWALRDLITGEQRKAKTFTECRTLAQVLSREISRYESYAYSPDTDAYYRGQKVRITALKKDEDGEIVALCTHPDGTELETYVSELYLREKDALLPGEEKH